MTDEDDPSERTVTLRPVGFGAEKRPLVEELRDVNGVKSVEKIQDPRLRDLAYGTEVIRIAIDLTANVSTGVLAAILYDYLKQRADSRSDENGGNPVNLTIGGTEVTSGTDEERIKEKLDEAYDAKG